MKKIHSKSFKFKGIGSKYKNIKSEYDNESFDSMLELRCYKWMKLTNRNFKFQVKYKLGVTSYRADIVFYHNDKEYVIDCKSKKTVTPLFKLKAKLFYYVNKYNIKCIFSLEELVKYINDIVNNNV